MHFLYYDIPAEVNFSRVPVAIAVIFTKDMGHLLIYDSRLLRCWTDIFYVSVI